MIVTLQYEPYATETMNPNSHNRTHHPIPSRSGMSGFSMIEMMISITIGLLIVAALVGVLSSSAGSTKTNDRTTELQSNGRYALSHLQQELHHAGNRGYSPKAPESAGWTTAAITNECQASGDAANSFVKNIRQSVWGKNDSNPFAANCLPAASYNSSNISDVLVIRHAAATPTLAASAVATTLYLNSSYNGISLLTGSSLPGTVVTGTENFALLVYVYYIGYDDNDVTLPALRRRALVNNQMVDEMVVSGIEAMQFEYGITTASGSSQSTQYFTANNISGSAGATGPTGWDGVNSVRIWLLARSAKAEPGYQNTNTYTMSNRVYGPVNDNFYRQIFSTVVQLRNFRD